MAQTTPSGASLFFWGVVSSFIAGVVVYFLMRKSGG